MGTTIALLIIKGEDCYIGHIGDSRIYLKTDGELHRITKDHSFVQGLVDQGIISDKDAESHPKKNQILKALGHSLEVQGTICQKPIKVKAGDVFLLCSDGLNGMINDEYIDRCINPTNLVESGKSLYQGAMDNRGADNITLILVGIEDSAHTSKTEFISYNPSKSPSTVYFFDKKDEQTSNSTQQQKTGRKNKNLIFLLSGILALILVGIVVYFKFFIQPPIGPDPKDKKEEVVQEDKMAERDLAGKTFQEIKELADKKNTKTINIASGKKIKTKDGKDAELIIEDNTLISVKEIKKETIKDTKDKNESKPKDEEKLPYLEVSKEKSLNALMGDLKAKGNQLSEEEIYQLNLEGAKEWPKEAERNKYINDRKVPKGFKLKYKTKKQAEEKKTLVEKKYIVQKEKSLKDLMVDLKAKGNELNEEEIYQLNLAEAKGLKKEAERNKYINDRKVPTGFSLKYKVLNK
jgi:hypothetical protein